MKYSDVVYQRSRIGGATLQYLKESGAALTIAEIGAGVRTRWKLGKSPNRSYLYHGLEFGIKNGLVEQILDELSEGTIRYQWKKK